MRPFSKVPHIFLTAMLFFPLLVCACSLPGTVPSVTPTQEQTSTPVPATAVPSSSPTPTETPIPEHLSVDQDELEGVTVVLSCSQGSKVLSTLKDLISRFNEDNGMGITVVLRQAVSTDELSSFILEENTEKPDLVIADSAWLRSESRNGADWMELSEFMQSTELSLDGENTVPIMSVMLAQEERDGEYYALPLWAEPAFLFYNKTWAIELGYEDTPSDLAAFAEQACAAGKASYNEKDEGRHGTGGWIVSSNRSGVMSWLLTFAEENQTPGQILRDENGNVFSDTAAWLRNLFDNGCAWNSRVKEPYDYFANRYALFYSGTYADAERQFNAFTQSADHAYDNWDLIFYPARAVGKQTDPRIYADISSAALLRGDAARMNAAWRFIRWLYEGENAAALSLSAGGWPVQDSDPITKLYRNSGEDKLYQSLSYRQYLVKNEADENWLTDQLILSDGFAYIFNPSVSAEGISGIWDQIGSSIAEVNAAADAAEK